MLARRATNDRSNNSVNGHRATRPLVRPNRPFSQKQADSSLLRTPNEDKSSASKDHATTRLCIPSVGPHASLKTEEIGSDKAGIV